jgi:uncharacterized protein YuzB (UPF0349 family)
MYCIAELQLARLCIWCCKMCAAAVCAGSKPDPRTGTTANESQLASIVLQDFLCCSILMGAVAAAVLCIGCCKTCAARLFAALVLQQFVQGASLTPGQVRQTSQL